MRKVDINKIEHSLTATIFVLFVAFSFISCPASSQSSVQSASQSDNTTRKLISFDISNAVSFSTTESYSSKRIRSDSVYDRDTSNLVKILADGSTVDAMSTDGEVIRANIKSIIKSPNTNDIYIWYDSMTYDGEWNVLLSSLICVHEDGSYTNLLGTESNRNYCVDAESDIQFDKDGNAYILARGVQDGTSVQDVYVYDPRTDERKTLRTLLNTTEGLIESFRLNADDTLISATYSENHAAGSVDYISIR